MGIKSFRFAALAIFLVPLIGYGQSNPLLELGTPVNNETLPQLASESIPYARLRAADREYRSTGRAGSIAAFASLDDGTTYWGLSRDAILHFVNVGERRHLGSWPLDTYRQYAVLWGESPQAAHMFHRPESFKQKYWTVDDPAAFRVGPDVVWSAPPVYARERVGCLARNPLRYGDVNDTGDDELVLFIGNEIQIFSTTEKKVIFAANWVNQDDVGDVANAAIRQAGSEHQLAYRYREQGEDAPQYIAESGRSPAVNDVFPAWRAFAKFYFGDFNEDSRPDLVMWRKLFESRLNSDSEGGFYKKAQGLVHYAFVDGEYVLQETEQEDIVSWLADRDLTWSQGFPRYSECPGEAGELIPEMHDPLLNDPEVLPGFVYGPGEAN
ncbi:hypothetical protein [Alkalilimnicola ehrlichii]|nr:hypothetical protein [Alkalilimnicola ehrlichii]